MGRRTEPQWTVSGVIDASLERVWAELINGEYLLSKAQKIAILRDRESFSFSVGQAGQGRMSIEVDTSAHSIALQGEWWYRGVNSVEPHPSGCRLTYDIYNVAGGPGWWLAQYVQGRQAAKGMTAQFQARLVALGAKLGCRATLA